MQSNWQHPLFSQCNAGTMEGQKIWRGTLKLDFSEADLTITVCTNKIRKAQNKHMNIVCQNLNGLQS